MMTDVVVALSLGGLLVGCVLLLTGIVPVAVMVVFVGCVLLLLTGIVAVVVIAPTNWELMVSSGIDAGESEYITSAWHVTNGIAKVGHTGACAPNPH